MFYQKGEWKVLSLEAIATKDEVIPIAKGETHARLVGQALHPELASAEALLKQKVRVGSYLFSSQYQQAPQSPEGNLIRPRWFPRYDAQPPLDSFERIVQSWDFASTISADSDYTVCTTWGIRANAYSLLDVLCAKMEFGNLIQAVPKMASAWRANAVLIEADGTGRGVYQLLRERQMAALIPIVPKLDKLARVIRASGYMEAGRVWLPKQAIWLPPYEEEMFSYDQVEHDDQVDSTCQFLNWAIASVPPQITLTYTDLRNPKRNYWDRMRG